MYFQIIYIQLFNQINPLTVFRLPKMPTAEFTTAAEEVKTLTKGCFLSLIFVLIFFYKIFKKF